MKGTARAESEENMTIYEITEKIVESKNNDIAKAFAMHIGSLLINNGIVPIMTEYTRNDVKNIKDANEYKLVMEYGISFNELDCSKHDREVYNKAIDDFTTLMKAAINQDWATNTAYGPITYNRLIDKCNEIADKLRK